LIDGWTHMGSFLHLVLPDFPLFSLFDSQVMHAYVLVWVWLLRDFPSCFPLEMLRLRKPESAVDLHHLWHLLLPGLLREATWSRCPHQVTYFFFNSNSPSMPAAGIWDLKCDPLFSSSIQLCPVCANGRPQG